MKPEAPKVLEDLNLKGYALILYSAQLPFFVNSLLQRHNIDLLFSNKWLVDSNHGKKTNEKTLIKFINELGLKFDSIVIVDDMSPVIEMAKRLNILTVGCSSLLDQNISNADFKISDIAELPKILNEIDSTNISLCN